MAAVAIIRIGTKDWPGLWRVVWDGEEWKHHELPKPRGLYDAMWQLEKILARTLFEETQHEIFKKMLDQEAPYPMDDFQYTILKVLERHVERGLGFIVMPMSEDYLFILE